MNANKAVCLAGLKEVKEKLQNNYDVILIDEKTLLVKPNPNTMIKINTSVPSSNTLPATGTITVCPMNSNASISGNTCSCHSECSSTSSHMCPLNKNNGNNNMANIIKPFSKGECLFRLSPTDTYNGIFLHAIIIHNESTDLKMTFGYDDKGVIQMVETINFLVK